MSDPPVDRRAGAVFVASSFAGSALHYLFQVVAARSLDKTAFANLSFWLANVSLGFVLASLTQYAGNFRPASDMRLRSIAPLLGAVVTILSLAVAVRRGWSPVTIGAVAIVSSAINGWLMGQAQHRLLFYTLSTATLLIAVVKVGLAVISIGSISGVDRFYLAIALSYLASTVFLAARLAVLHGGEWSGRSAGAASSVGAAIILALAAGVLPQLDLIAVSATQPAGIFQDFARVSLFYKALYFGLLIVAQWMLPYQIRGRSPALARLDGAMLFAAGPIAAAIVALSTPLVASLVMHWPDTPPRLMVFLSCWNMCMLSWVFLLVQEACAHGRLNRAATLLTALAAVYAVVWATAPPLTVYFIVTITAASACIAVHLRRGRDMRSSPTV